MVIVKFILVIMLFYLLFLVVTTAERIQPKSGPNYYLDMPGVTSVQPQYRISRQDALQRPHAIEVECFNNGTPYRITKIAYGVRLSSTYYYIDAYGRLGYVGYDDGDGVVRLRALTPPKN